MKWYKLIPQNTNSKMVYFLSWPDFVSSVGYFAQAILTQSMRFIKSILTMGQATRVQELTQYIFGKFKRKVQQSFVHSYINRIFATD